jgi:hypothetical protein
MNSLVSTNLIMESLRFSGLIFIFWLALGIIIFLLLRELMMWYWRINENTESLKRIADSLEILVASNIIDNDRKKSKNNRAEAINFKEEKI